MNLLDVTEQFSTEERCLEYLAQHRWPDGVRCIACGSERISKFTSTGKTGRPRHLYECLNCATQFTAKVGTLFEDSHLPLRKWFMAIVLLAQSKKGMSAMQLSRALSVTYKTAWYLAHRIREAMQENGGKLWGTVEVDETYIGGKHRGAGRRGRGADHAPVIGLKERGGRVRFIPTADTKANTIYKVLHQNVSSGVERIITDEYAVYPFAMGPIFRDKHKTICHKREYVNGDIHTNTVESAFSLIKRGIMGTYHQLSVKHLHRYMKEFEYRFNRRDSEPLMFSRIMHHLATTPALRYKKLIG